MAIDHDAARLQNALGVARVLLGVFAVSLVTFLITQPQTGPSQSMHSMLLGGDADSHSTSSAQGSPGSTSAVNESGNAPKTSSTVRSSVSPTAPPPPLAPVEIVRVTADPAKQPNATTCPAASDGTEDLWMTAAPMPVPPVLPVSQWRPKDSPDPIGINYAPEKEWHYHRTAAPDSPGAVARRERTVPIDEMAELAMAMPDPLAKSPNGVLHGRVPKVENASASLSGTFAKQLADLPLEPLFQAFPGKAARVAVVTAWSMNYTGYRRAVDVGPAMIVNKVLYCRRNGFDLYVHDTAELITQAGYTPSNRIKSDGRSSAVRFHQWAKPLGVARLLPHYDWVVWHDPDIFFMNFSVTVFELLRDYAKGSAADEVFLYTHEHPGGTWDTNTGHYAVKGMSDATIGLLDASWRVPPSRWGPFNDQGAMNFLINSQKQWRKHLRAAPPLRSMAALVFDSYFYAPWRRYRYGDPNVHLTYCAGDTGCNEAIAHLFVTFLTLNGLYNGTVPANVLYLPKPPPLVRPAGTFGAPALLPGKSGEKAPTVLVVTLGRYWDRGAPAWLVDAAQSRWQRFCERTGCGFDARGRPDLIWAWHSEYRVQPGPRARWKLLQTWLPYADWVLYVDADVAIADDGAGARGLQELVRSVPDGVDIVGAPSAVHGGGGANGERIPAGHALLVRRSAWSLRVLEGLWYAPTEGQMRQARLSYGWAFEPAMGPLLTGISWERLQLRDDLVAAPPELCRDATGESVTSAAQRCGPACAFGQPGATRHWLVRLPGAACTAAASECARVAGRLGMRAATDPPTPEPSDVLPTT